MSWLSKFRYVPFANPNCQVASFIYSLKNRDDLLPDGASKLNHRLFVILVPLSTPLSNIKRFSPGLNSILSTFSLEDSLGGHTVGNTSNLQQFKRFSL